jgi:hypothetical protein
MSGRVVVGYLDTVADGEELAGAAREQGADFVVLGSTHRGPLGEIVPGTTMQHVLAGGGCSVAVAPPYFATRAEGESVWQPPAGDTEDVGMRVIGVGFDGSRESRGAGPRHRAGAPRRRRPARLLGRPPRRRDRPRRADGPDRARHDRTGEQAGRAARDRRRSARRGQSPADPAARLRRHLHQLFHKSVAGLVAGAAQCPVLICPTSIAAPVGAA